MYRSEPPISPRHHASITSNNRSSETLQNITTTTTPLSSTITLRDTSIREQPILKDSTYFRGSSYTSSKYHLFSLTPFFGTHGLLSFLGSSGFTPSIYSSRERDCGSPFRNSSSLIPSSVLQYNNTLGSSRENNNIILRESGVLNSTKVAPNRLLSSGIDQRILKQSTEDCRRLLQQVSY